MSQQLTDNGAVIGYQPRLEYTKEMNQKATSVSGTKHTDASGAIQYSSTLSGLINNLPGATISDVEYVVGNIKSLIDKLADKFQPGSVEGYDNVTSLVNALAVSDMAYAHQFIEAHKHNINGSVVPELIGHLYSVAERMQVLGDILKELYYGTKDITQREMNEKDADAISRLKSLEASDNRCKINYVAISYDSMLNRAVSTESFAVNKQAIKMSKVPDANVDLTNDASHKKLIGQLYVDVNSDLDYRQEAFEIQQTVEILEKTLYNYYNRRNDYIGLYDICDGQEVSSMGRRLGEYQRRCSRSLENIVRTLAGSQHYLSQMTELEQEKTNLMRNYSKLNYKY